MSFPSKKVLEVVNQVATEKYIVVLDKGQLHELETLCELRRQLLHEDKEAFPNAKFVQLELKQLRGIYQAFLRKTKII